ncbi:MAG: GtrA family protein [Methanoregula sp.]
MLVLLQDRGQLRCKQVHHLPDANRRTAVQFATFSAIYISCLIVNVGIVWLTVTYLSLTPITAKIIAICCTFLWNCHGQSRFTFRAPV